MRFSRPAATARRAAILAVTIAAALGVTSAQALAAAKSSFDPSSLGFADAVDGAASQAQTVTLTNTGDAPLDLTGGAASDTPQFTTANDTCATTPSLGPGAACSVDVSFNADTPDPVGGSLNFATSLGRRAVLLRGNAPKSGASPDTVNFTGRVGTTSAPIAVILTNGTKATASLTNITATATGPFVIAPASCPELAPGEACTINVAFKPTAAGSVEGKLVFASSDPISPPPTVRLTGMATLGKRAAVSAVSFAPKTLAAGKRGSVRYTLSGPANVAIVVERRVGTGSRYKRVTSLKATGKLGRNTFAVKKSLSAGSYRVKVTATNEVGTSATRAAAFTVRARRRG